jgi:hypothetical protein
MTQDTKKMIVSKLPKKSCHCGQVVRPAKKQRTVKSRPMAQAMTMSSGITPTAIWMLEPTDTPLPLMSDHR